MLLFNSQPSTSYEWSNQPSISAAHDCGKVTAFKN